MEKRRPLLGHVSAEWFGASDGVGIRSRSKPSSGGFSRGAEATDSALSWGSRGSAIRAQLGWKKLKESRPFAILGEIVTAPHRIRRKKRVVCVGKSRRAAFVLGWSKLSFTQIYHPEPEKASLGLNFYFKPRANQEEPFFSRVYGSPKWSDSPLDPETPPIHKLGLINMGSALIRIGSDDSMVGGHLAAGSRHSSGVSSLLRRAAGGGPA